MKTYRISMNMAIFMVLTAVILDVGELLLDTVVIGEFINPVIDILVGLLYPIWFYFLKVNFSKTRGVVFFGLEMCEIAADGLIPLWTIDIVAVIFMVYLEDKSGMNATALMQNPATQAQLKQGIMTGVNRTLANQPKLQQQLAKATKGKWDHDVGMNKPLQTSQTSTSNSNPNGGITVNISSHPDPRVETQRLQNQARTNRQNNANNDSKKMAA